MIIYVTSEIQRNKKQGNYTDVEGKHMIILKDGDEEIARHLADVLWAGSGSPFPTPPGGPWKVTYVPNHKKFGKCFFVKSDKETEIFIHYAKKLSYGCFIVNPTVSGNLFMETLVDNRDGLTLVHHPVLDHRKQEEKNEFPIDYNKIGFVG